MSHKFVLSLFLVSLIGGGILFFGVSSSIAAMVDGKPIWKKDFNETVSMIIKYYYAADEYNTATEISELEIMKDKDLMKRVQKEALERMIGYKIMTLGIEKIKPDWEESAQAKISDALTKVKENDKFEEGVKALYGMSQADFKGKVLIPQAQFEILSEELKKQNKNYEEWMKEEKEKASIRIMIDGLGWKNGEVVIRN